MIRKKLALGSYLQKATASYHAVWSHALLLKKLAGTLHDALPISLAEHCTVANMRDTELVIGVDSPVWSARLRFYTPQILKHFARLPDIGVQSVRVMVIPKSAPEIGQSRCSLRLSAQNSEVLARSARTIEDKQLRAVLLKLAARARSNQD